MGLVGKVRIYCPSLTAFEGVAVSNLLDLVMIAQTRYFENKGPIVLDFQRLLQLGEVLSGKTWQMAPITLVDVAH